MTADRLAEVQTRLDAAMAAPWEFSRSLRGHLENRVFSSADVNLMESAPTDIEFLLGLVRQQQEQIEDACGVFHQIGDATLREYPDDLATINLRWLESRTGRLTMSESWRECENCGDRRLRHYRHGSCDFCDCVEFRPKQTYAELLAAVADLRRQLDAVRELCESKAFKYTGVESALGVDSMASSGWGVDRADILAALDGQQ